MTILKIPGRIQLFILLLVVLLIVIGSCEMPATKFDNIEPAQLMEKSVKSVAVTPDSSIIVMTWNIRFGIGRGPWFGDACGYKVIYEKDSILANLQRLALRIEEIQPDILLLQEVDKGSARSAYVDQVSWILENTYFNYAVSGSQWKAQFIPSDGLGRMDETNAIFSRWPLKDPKRIQLQLRSDQGALEKYFYERCCIVETRAEIPGFRDLIVLNIHASAFAIDNSRQIQYEEFKNELDRVAAGGDQFVAGGDLNTLPPGSTKTDYCIEDMCDGESFHNAGDNPLHKGGSYYTPETEWLVPLYNAYKNAIPLDVYLADQSRYFTHTTRPAHFWDRTLDYLFTNEHWGDNASFVMQDFLIESDHAPVGGELILLK